LGDQQDGKCTVRKGGWRIENRGNTDCQKEREAVSSSGLEGRTV